MTQESDAVEVGPYCVGTREGNETVYPAAVARQLGELRRAMDKAWWRAAADALSRAGNSVGFGRLNSELCQALAVAIDSGLRGSLPVSFAAAAKVNVATYARGGVPDRQIRAVAYVVAKELGYVSDPAPVKRVQKRFKIDRRTWHRWRKQYGSSAEEFLYVHLCEQFMCEELSRPWANLAVLVCLGLATDDEARELHLAKGGRIVTGRDGRDVWVHGSGPLPPDI